MVYPGARSTGCGQCRKRKIKCDEARPACGRCQKSGLECPGYYRPLELRFHTDGGQLLPSRSQKKVGAGAGAGGSGSADTPSPAGSGHEAEAAAQDRDHDDDARHHHNQALLFLPPRLNQQPEPLWEKESVLYFFEEYCNPPSPGFFSAFLNFLPNIMLQSASGSTLRAASTASACLALSRQSKSTQLYQRACAYYGQGGHPFNSINFAS